MDEKTAQALLNALQRQRNEALDQAAVMEARAVGLEASLKAKSDALSEATRKVEELTSELSGARRKLEAFELMASIAPELSDTKTA